jgi:hypothetical protein
MLKDQKNDTLLSVGNLKIDIDMLKLLKKDISIEQLTLENVYANAYRNAPDTNFNFSYIIDSFTGGPKTEPAKPKDTTKSSLKIEVKSVVFNNIHARFNDYTGGTRLAVDLDELRLKMKKLDLDQMLFHVKDFTVAGLNTVFYSDTSYLPKKIDTSTKKSQFHLIADNVHLQHIAFKYDNNLNKFLFAINLKDFKTDVKNFDLARSLVDIGNFNLDTTGIILTMGKHTTAPAPIDTIVKIDTTQGWRVTAKDVRLAGVNFKMDNENKPHQPKGMDYAHLDVRGLTTNLQQLFYTSDTIAGDLKQLSVTEQSGLDVRELRTVFNYNKQGATLNNLYAQTPNTILQDHLEVHYPSIDALKTQMKLMQLKVNLKKSVVGVSDILLFAPDLAKQPIFGRNKNAHLQLEATLGGYLSALNIPHFYLAGFTNTEILLSGQLNGLPDANAIRYSFNIGKLQSSSYDLNPLLPASVQKNVRIPDRFGITGQVAGTTKDYVTNLLLVSSDGGAAIKGNIAMSPGKGRERYDIALRTQELNLGRILRKDSLVGRITATVNAKGRSFDVNTMNAVLNGSIASAYLKGYNYHQVTFDGNIANKVGDLHMHSADPNIHIKLDAHADMTGKYAAARADLQMDSVNFQALKLYKSELRVHGNIHADFPELNPDYPRGDLYWQKPIIVADGKRYELDSLYVTSHPSADTGQNIVVNLDVMQAVVRGKTPLTQVGDIITDHINRHYSFASAAKKDSLNRDSATVAKRMKRDTAMAHIPSDYNLMLLATVLDRPLLHSLLPGLSYMDSIHVDGSLTPRDLTLNVKVPQLVYSTSTINNGVVQVNGTDSAFTYKVTVDQIQQKELNLWFANIHGNLDQNTITTNVSIADSAKKERFALAATLTKQGDTQIVQLQPGLKLNYQTWNVAQPNRIAMVPDGFYISNFNISNNNQYIKANSDQPKANTPLKIDISNFMLANITNIISKDTLLANGLLGGNINIEKMKPSPELSGDLKIQNLSVMGDTIGNVNVQVNNKEADAINATVTIAGSGNDISLAGNYYLKRDDALDFTLKLNALSLHSIEGVTMGNLRKSSGFIRGNVQIQGPTSAPRLTGELHTDNLETTVSMLNAYFKMPAEKIVFNGNNIAFNNFNILDSAGQKATISGTVNTEDLSNMAFDLNFRSKQWRALHSTPKDNKNFYGDLLLTTNLKVSGTPSVPNVDGDIKFLKGTDVTVVMPEKDPQLESSLGIVHFIDMSDTNRAHILAVRHDTTTKKRKLSGGSNINVNIDINKEAQFSVVIDQASGDFIKVRGTGTLNASVLPGGGVALTGSYELHEGTYQMNYNFIKRKFSIQDGSTITFAGDPEKAQVDIVAVYEADIAPYDLVQREVPEEAQLNYYKQHLPFNVQMHLKGNMLQPSLTFDVILPENKVYPLTADQIELIQGKLNQVRTDTSELNKQVFAVLILNRFISDDPFSSGSDGGVGFVAMQSVSRFIGEQLDRFAKGLIKGVDISADLATTEDYTTGDMRQRTDLNLAASKRLLNDRLKLTVGNDFELEGPQTNNSSQSDLIPSNLAADYLLTADGRYTVRAYRRNYDEGVLEGYVTETGVNFIVSLDYNHFKNVFRKKNQKKEQSKGASK